MYRLAGAERTEGIDNLVNESGNTLCDAYTYHPPDQIRRLMGWPASVRSMNDIAHCKYR